VHNILYAVGGYDGANAVGTVEAYNPVTNTWTTKAPMPTPRQDLAVGVVNNILYAIGGATTFDSNPPSYGGLATVEAYDPDTDTWTTKAPMPTPRFYLTVGVVNDILYAIGGGGAYAQNPPAMTTVEAYDPATDTWTTKAPMPTAAFLGRAAGVVKNEFVYVVEGDSTVSGHDGDVLVYDADTDAWMTKAPLPGAALMPPASCVTMTVTRQYPSVGVASGIVYAVGGYTFVRGCIDPTVFAAASAYDPTIDTWKAVAPMPTARYQLGVGVVNDIVYAVGGSTATGGALNTVEAYAAQSVGGLAEPPNVAALPAGTRAPADHTTDYVLSVALAFVAAITAGGWYVRRRRSRARDALTR
jgi:N-acetylneuraminic acid mutarotase